MSNELTRMSAHAVNLESLEAAADEMCLPDGRWRCDCGIVFDPNEEGDTLSSSPFAMPVCGACLQTYINLQRP